MMSKKDMLTLGVLAIGGVAVASSFAGGGDTGALEGKKGRAGGILGSQQGYGAPAVYQLPAQAAVTFPKAPSFDIGSFLAPLSPLPSPISGRGAAGVSAAPKKISPYLYTGGEVKAGAVSVAPWAMGVSTPAEIGVTSALGIAKKGGFMGTGMTQDAYKSQYAERTYSAGAPASKKTSTDASKAISHAKRLRAGRGD